MIRSPRMSRKSSSPWRSESRRSLGPILRMGILAEADAETGDAVAMDTSFVQVPSGRAVLHGGAGRQSFVIANARCVVLGAVHKFRLVGRSGHARRRGCRPLP